MQPQRDVSFATAALLMIADIVGEALNLPSATDPSPSAEFLIILLSTLFLEQIFSSLLVSLLKRCRCRSIIAHDHIGYPGLGAGSRIYYVIFPAEFLHGGALTPGDVSVPQIHNFSRNGQTVL